MAEALPSTYLSAIKRARMLVSCVSSPKQRAALAQVLCGDSSSDVHSVAGPRFDWISGDGIDVAKLRETVDRLTDLLRDDVILIVSPIATLPSNEARRLLISESIIRTVFTRLGSLRAISEKELNAAIRMFAGDPAIVRRDCIDSGLLRRDDSGNKYYLAHE